MHGNARLFLGLVAFIQFQALITQYLKFGQENYLVFARPCCDDDWDVCESLDWVNGWDRISLPLEQRAIVELTPLEEEQSSISIDFDHVSDLVQLGMMHFLNIFLLNLRSLEIHINGLVSHEKIFDHIPTIILCRTHIRSGCLKR